MKLSDQQTLELAESVLAEPGTSDGRIVLWILIRHESDGRHWERVGTASHAPVSIEAGCIRAVAATSTQARHTTAGWLRRFLRRASPDKLVTLPNGQLAERCGHRRSDVMLVWAEHADIPLDEARVRARWPHCQDIREVARNLFVVWGVEPDKVAAPEATAREKADRLVSLARHAGDGHAIAALADLGCLQIQEGQASDAIATLEEALGLARQLGEPGREADILSQLGTAAYATGDTARAVAWLEQGLALAITANDAHTERLIRERLGLAIGSAGDLVDGLAHLERALTLAIQVGDRRHESKILWLIALKHAESGNRGAAIAAATRSIAILDGLGDPRAAWYREHLRRYRSGVATAPQPLGEGPNSATTGPGLLRMALTATKAMAAFLGSGLKTTPPDARQARLRACAGCEHHTGMRCRACGCFTDAKASMLSEDCPLGKWPA